VLLRFFILAIAVCTPEPMTRADAGTARPAPPPDPLLPLREASASGDPAEIERAALRLPAAMLASALDAPGRAVRYAAIAAAARSPSSFDLLERIVDRLGTADRETASRAAAAALEVTRTVDERAFAAAEIDRADLGRIARSACRIASDSRLAPDVRAAAATIAARLQIVAPIGASPLLPALSDDDPTVRHAVLEALRAWGPRLGRHRAAIEAIVRDAADPRSSLLAAAALCAAGPLDDAVAERARDLLPRGRWSDRALLAPCLGSDEPRSPPARRAKKRP